MGVYVTLDQLLGVFRRVLGCAPERHVVRRLATDHAELRRRYIDACERCWDPVKARARFAEYDEYREVFCREMYAWLYGTNPRAIDTLTGFAWEVTHTPINEGGKFLRCLDFSDRKQRVYLGGGLLEYLGLLKDAMEEVYGGQRT